ncbi:MAG: site-specific DNA-methyltransferase [Carboxydocellales bacterium]
MPVNKDRAGRNRTLTLTPEERLHYTSMLKKVTTPLTKPEEVVDSIIYGDTFLTLALLPCQSVDLLVVDPPYNLTKAFNSNTFASRSSTAYAEWLEGWFTLVLPLLKPTASLYICGDWRSSTPIHQVLDKYVLVRNRITWEREKGRGALNNWKNASEDIWFATVGKEFTFNVEAVKLKRKVIAPYRDQAGSPKDWEEGAEGNYRLTHPSNLWSDLTVPFWSMPENTDHPAQKPEKLVAKIILASSQPGQVILDPFLGSGTTAVVAKKLGRRFIGIELDQDYCCLAAKRLALAEKNPDIQGYSGGYFWERNSMSEQKQQGATSKTTPNLTIDTLF